MSDNTHDPDEPQGLGEPQGPDFVPYTPQQPYQLSEPYRPSPIYDPSTAAWRKITPPQQPPQQEPLAEPTYLLRPRQPQRFYPGQGVPTAQPEPPETSRPPRSPQTKTQINPEIIIAIVVALAVLIGVGVMSQSRRGPGPGPSPSPSATETVTTRPRVPEPFTQTTVMGAETAWLDVSYSSGDIVKYSGTGFPIALTSDRSTVLLANRVKFSPRTEEVTGGLMYVSLETGEVLDTLEGVDCLSSRYLGGGSLFCLGNPRLENAHKLLSIVRVEVDSREVTTLIEVGRATELEPFADHDGVVYAVMNKFGESDKTIVAFDHDGELLWETQEDTYRCALGDGFVGCWNSSRIFTLDSANGTLLASAVRTDGFGGWCIDGAYARTEDGTHVVYDKVVEPTAVYEDATFLDSFAPNSWHSPVLLPCDDIPALQMRDYPEVEALDIDGNVVMTEDSRTYTFTETGATLPEDNSLVSIRGITADGSVVVIEQWSNGDVILVDSNGTILTHIPYNREERSPSNIGGYLFQTYYDDNDEPVWTAWVPR